ncbi:MAG: universal stress protein [Desulfobacca sp.]|nr:universal stress protein [Desulfobacca sp.]
MFKKVLVAYDGSEDSKKALEIALELSRKFDSEVHLLTIIEQLPHYAATIGEVKEALAEITKEIEKQQTLVCEEARERGIELKCRILPGHEVEAIIAYAQKGNFDALLLGRKGRSAILHTQSGSTAVQITTHAPCTVILAHREKKKE